MTLTDEEKVKYENEFSKFLAEKIRNLGGSLQFQYLTGLLPQLSFEVKSAVGSSKFQLMKFLKSHPNKFNVDSKCIITNVETSAVEEDSNDDDDVSMLQAKSLPPPTIKNGEGRISKLHSEFGFIKAEKPFKTTVYFRADHLSGDKNDLLAEFDLQVSMKVCFNAEIGHKELDAKYRATKVWRQLKSDGENHEVLDLSEGNFSDFKGKDNSAKFSNKISEQKHEEKNINVKQKEENISGEGVIQNVFPQVGFISVTGKVKDTVFFHINVLADSDGIGDLTKVLKSGDNVEFDARRSNKKDSKAKWQAIAVSKKIKNKFINSDSKEMDNKSSESSNYKGSRKEMIKNQKGKISILQNGINITFGEQFTEIADGNSSTYFLYGAKVTDIPWEFSDGDEVCFDAVKIKAEPGWKAVLVWGGDKPDYVLPTCLGDFSEFTDDETCDEIPVIKNYSRSKSNSSSERSVKTNTCSSNIEQMGKKKGVELHDHSKKKNGNKSDRECKKQNLRSPQSNMPVRELNKERQKKYAKIKGAASNRFKGKQNFTPNKKDSCSEDHQNKYLSKNNATYRNLSVSENSNSETEDQDNELQIVSAFLNSSLKNKQSNKRYMNQPEGKASTSFKSETDDSEHNEEVSEYKKKNYGKSSIKKFQDIDGKVTKVNCKFAFAENSDLQEPVLFFSNVFYNNGQSVEEQQVDDLREIISSGVTVKLNCFEIVDDSGKIHHTVTMAWLGEQPRISEKTAEEFIEENNLSVTIKDESNEGVASAKTGPKKFLFAANKSDSEDEIKRYASPMKFSSSENASDDETSLSSKCSETKQNKVFLKRAESSIDFKLLSKIVSQQLESKGLCYPDSEINLNALSTEIVDVIVQRHHRAKESDNQSIKLQSTEESYKEESVCSHCGKIFNGTSSIKKSTFSSKEVQTIVTGEIISQSIFTEI